MMKRIATSTLVALNAATLFFFAEDGAAYSYQHCNNDVNQWRTNIQPSFWRNVYSIYPSGDRDLSATNALNRLDTYSGITRPLTRVGDSTDTVINLHNGYNEYGVVIPSEIDDEVGLTAIVYSTKCEYSWQIQDIIEADVMVASDVNFASAAFASQMPPARLSSGVGRQAFMHEFGHALGLQHSADDLSIMKEALPFPLVGGPGDLVSLFTDDILGLRFLYPDNPVTNLAISGQRFVAGIPEDYETGFPNITATRGVTPIPFPHTTQNQSASAKLVNVWFMLTNASNQYVIGTAAYNIGTWLKRQDANFAFIAPLTVAPGTYVRRTYIDPFPGTVTEFNEGDNELVYAKQVVVQ